MPTSQKDSKVTCDPSTGTADPEIATPKGRKAKLTFKLKDKNKWKWGSPAIVIENGGSQFSTPITDNNGDIEVTDDNTDNTLYKYTFNAVNKESGNPVSIDPSIQNSADNIS